MKLVFDPALHHGAPPRKNPCADCHFCQQCADSRCHACRSQRQKQGAQRKLGISEQIRLYDELNRNACVAPKERREDRPSDR